MKLQDEILKGLKHQFQFRKTRGDWMQEGKCPQCGKWEAFAAATDPKIVRCGRSDRCGWEDSVRNLLPDLFEDWSNRFKSTEDNPNAAADAYLQHERGLDMRFLRGTYSQELFREGKTGQTSATIRFQVARDLLDVAWWERIIDRPGRFERKAHFQPRAQWSGHCWLHAQTSIEQLAAAKDIWITEGIFDAVALAMARLDAVSNMSTGPYPEHFLAALRKACEEAGRTDRPRLIFAFDVGAAGVFYARKHIDRATREGWTATAAQVRPDGEGTKLDWNDLQLRQQAWKGKPEDGPLGENRLGEYLHNGAITVAKSAYEKAKLIIQRMVAQTRLINSFDMRFDNRIFWVRVKTDEEDDAVKRPEIHEIANCAFRLLYRERDEIADETHYFLQIDFPFESASVKARFSSAACANSGEFKKRLMAFAGMWSGTADQLDRLMKNQTRRLKVVEPIHFTGYSRDHGAWVFGDLAVHQGRVLQVNSENYFDVGKHAVKLRSSERMLDIAYDPDRQDISWLPDIWTAFGPRGLIALAFFVMSLFAVQIRDRHKSLGFLEITGPPGSGKSTLIEFLWKLFGRAGYEGFDPNKGTRAFLSRSFVKVSGLPVGLIEGGREDEKRIHNRQFDFNELLVLFNGRSPRGIGRKSGGFETEEPPFLGAIYLVQNERIDAIPAVLERLMSMAIDKSLWGEGTKEAANRLEAWPMDKVSGTLVHIVRQEADFLPFFFERFDHHDKTMASRVEGLTNARPIKCHSQLAAALEALPKLFPNCEQDWVDAAIAYVDRMALDRQQSAGGDHPLVADFWEKVDFLLSKENDDQHENGQSLNRHRKSSELIAINLPDFEARCRSAGIYPPPMDLLKKLLRQSKSRKWVSYKGVNCADGKSRQCWIFQQPGSGTTII